MKHSAVPADEVRTMAVVVVAAADGDAASVADGGYDSD